MKLTVRKFAFVASLSLVACAHNTSDADSSSEGAVSATEGNLEVAFVPGLMEDAARVFSESTFPGGARIRRDGAVERVTFPTRRFSFGYPNNAVTLGTTQLGDSSIGLSGAELAIDDQDLKTAFEALDPAGQTDEAAPHGFVYKVRRTRGGRITCRRVTLSMGDLHSCTLSGLAGVTMSLPGADEPAPFIGHPRPSAGFYALPGVLEDLRAATGGTQVTDALWAEHTSFSDGLDNVNVVATAFSSGYPSRTSTTAPFKVGDKSFGVFDAEFTSEAATRIFNALPASADGAVHATPSRRIECRKDAAGKASCIVHGVVGGSTKFVEV
jgi:hypothetical protein